MNPINVLILDDEPLARDILETFVLKIPGLHVVGICKNALEAFSILNKQRVDLLLSDINMPEISGIEFLNTLKSPPLVIFTTAFGEYAVESYELNAVDYLVKPVSFDRFLRAINKATELLKGTATTQQAPVATPSAAAQNIMFVKTSGKLQKIDLDKLWLIEALKDYLKLHIDAEKVVIHSTMKNFEDQLAGMPHFLRVNKSYIVNVKHIEEIIGNTIIVKKFQVPIGNTYKQEVFDYFEKLRL